ncbi:hypothetical protein [Exiguobacterium sp.]|uniref:hypothetical protein n=1 Tax=Exiguobacterium sp. TaxID=44751 RepID=UPI00289EE808|nr:hypothetical protein [Exiguobacterium sp.]
METYFVSYSYVRSPGNFGFGHTEVKMNNKITNFEVLKHVANEIEKINDLPKESVVIMNFKRFSEG